MGIGDVDGHAGPLLGGLFRDESQLVRGVLEDGFGVAYAGESFGQSEDRRLPVDLRGALVVLFLRGQGKPTSRSRGTTSGVLP